jgi:hypothetical protein
LSRLRTRLTYANVIATIALFIALGGASYAATQLPRNSVGPKQLKREAVNGAKVKIGTIPATAIKGGVYTKAESGARYLGGTIVINKTISGPLDKGKFVTGKVECPAGYQAIGGGVDPRNVLQAKVSVSGPLIAGEEPQLKPDGQYGPSNGWFGAVTTQGGDAGITGVVLQVICAPLG